MTKENMHIKDKLRGFFNQSWSEVGWWELKRKTFGSFSLQFSLLRGK